MLTQGEDVEAHALAGRGWSIRPSLATSGAIARRSAPTSPGSGQPGVRRRAAPDPIEPFVAYLGPASRRPAPVADGALR